MLTLCIFAAVDLVGRAATLVYLMHNAEVRCASYRTWVLLVAFINFAFIFYWLLAKPKQKKED